jgi:hypothetical protein
VSGKRAARASELRTLPRPHLFTPSIVMAQQSNVELLSREDRLTLALQDIQSNPLRAAAIYDVSKSTLRTRRARTASRRDTYPNLLRLTRHEEDTIIQYTRKLNARGFAPTLIYVREIAN